jgi:hypothetical protein
VAASSLGPRGLRLWLSLSDRVDGERGLVLLEEACRTADRLDRLDSLLSGDTESWARIEDTRDGMPSELIIDSALSEARQQGAALLRLLTSLPMVRESDDGDADAWLDELPAAVRDS